MFDDVPPGPFAQKSLPILLRERHSFLDGFDHLEPYV